MGFRNKKNRVHPSGNKKKQQRKEKKRRRLARLVEKMNPFSCCTGESIPKNAICPETYLRNDQCPTKKVIIPDAPPTSPRGSGISATAERSRSSFDDSQSTASSKSAIVMEPPKTVTKTVPLASPRTSRSSVEETSPTITRLRLVSSTDSSSSDDSKTDKTGLVSDFSPSREPQQQLHQDVTTKSGSSSYHTYPKSPKGTETAKARSCILTDYRHKMVDLRDDFLMTTASTVVTPKQPINPRSYYSQLVEKTPATLGDSHESLETRSIVRRKESEISSDSDDSFDDCFEPTRRNSQSRENHETKEESDGDAETLSDDRDDCPIERFYQSESEEMEDTEQHGEDNIDQPSDPHHNAEEQHLSSEEDLEFFPEQEDVYLPLIETSESGLRGWLLPPGLHQYNVQPEPPYSLEEGQNIMSCAINHTVIAVAFYANEYQSGYVFRGKSCPYSIEVFVRSSIRMGNTTHLTHYPYHQYLNAIEAINATRLAAEDNWSLECDMESILAPYRELGIELPEEDQPTGLPMEIIQPQNNDSSLAYHVSQLRVEESEALLYTFNSYFMVFVPTSDGRILLIDVHQHRAMRGGAIILVCPKTKEHIQDMLDKYHSEQFQSSFNLGQGTKFSFKRYA